MMYASIIEGVEISYHSWMPGHDPVGNYILTARNQKQISLSENAKGGKGGIGKAIGRQISGAQLFPLLLR
jgi:hypothetical protein